MAPEPFLRCYNTSVTATVPSMEAEGGQVSQLSDNLHLVVHTNQSTEPIYPASDREMGMN